MFCVSVAKRKVESQVFTAFWFLETHMKDLGGSFKLILISFPMELLIQFITKTKQNNLQQKKCGRQLTDRNSRHSHSINIYSEICKSVRVAIYSFCNANGYFCLLCRALSLTDQRSKLSLLSWCIWDGQLTNCEYLCTCFLSFICWTANPSLLNACYNGIARQSATVSRMEVLLL